MNRRINIVLPEGTIRTIDRMVKPGERSRFINNAVQHFVANRSSEALRARLEETTIRDRDLERETAAEWAAVDYESWQRIDEPEPARKPITPSGAKSTSQRSNRR